MRALVLPVLLATSTLLAQSPLTTLYGGSNRTAPGGQVFFDLTATTTLTVLALDINTDSAPGVIGTIEVYTTLPGITTYAGHEATVASWTAAPVASGQVIAAGANQPSYVCLSPGLVLQPGTIGIALRHVDIQPWYSNGAAPTYSTAELTLTAGSVQGVPWTAPTGPRVWNGSIHYAVGSVPHACASHRRYGPGCYQAQASFYQMFSTAPEAAAALTGRTLSLLPGVGGYTVLNNPPGVAFVPPPGTATALAADDAELAFAWPTATPFGGAGGPTSFHVHSNGIVAVASIEPLLTPNEYRANAVGLLDCPVTAWWSWHDYNAAAAGSGLIKMHEAAGWVFVTWDNVESYPAATPNPSTLQFQFELATGVVNYVWQSIASVGLSVYGDSHVIGYSPGGPSFDPGPVDLATLTSLSLTVADQPPLTLVASPRPALGSTVTWTTSQASPGGLGILFLSLADLGVLSPAGFDLAGLGAPGCVANVDINLGIGNVISNLGGPFPTMAVSLGIPQPASLVGLSLYAQSVWLDPVANPGGLITSNGVRSVIGTF